MRSKTLFLMALVMVLSLVLAACGGGGEEASTGAGGGDPKAGEALFAQSVIGSQPGCSTCHSLEVGVVIVGPSLAEIGHHAGEMVSGMSAEEYLRQSILEPDAVVEEGYAAGTMPKVWGDELTEQQVQDLIAYMLTLK